MARVQSRSEDHADALCETKYCTGACWVRLADRLDVDSQGVVVRIVEPDGIQQCT